MIYFGVAVLLIVRFMARLAKLESKSPVKTLLLGPGAGLTAAVDWGPIATPPVTPDGCNRSPNASKPKNSNTHASKNRNEINKNLSHHNWLTH